MQRYRSAVAARAKKVVNDTRTGLLAGGGGGWFAGGATGSWLSKRESEGKATTFTLMGREIPIAEAAGGAVIAGSALLLKKPSQRVFQLVGALTGTGVAAASHGIRKYKSA